MGWKDLRERAESALTVWNLCVTAYSAVSFGSFAWAASASEWVAGYGPIGWLTAGVLGTLLTTLIGWVLMTIRRKWVLTDLTQKFYAQGSSINPMDAHFLNKRIHLRDLLPPENRAVENKVFQDCELIGPLNIYLINGDLDGNRYTAVDHIIVDRQAVLEGRVRHAAVFQNCRFIRCRIFNVSFLVLEQNFRTAERHGGCNWITHTPDNPSQAPLPMPVPAPMLGGGALPPPGGRPVP